MSKKFKTHLQMPFQSAALEGRSADKTRVPSRNGADLQAACQHCQDREAEPVSSAFSQVGDHQRDVSPMRTSSGRARELLDKGPAVVACLHCVNLMKAWWKVAGICLSCGYGMHLNAWREGSIELEISSQSLEWTIPHPGLTDCPIVGSWAISELNWKFVSVGANAEILGSSENGAWIWWLRGSAGSIVNGNALDRDWQAPNYALEISRTESSVRGWEGGVQLRSAYCWEGEAFALAPYIGVDFRGISLRELGLFRHFEINYGDLETYVCSKTGELLSFEGSVDAWVACEQSHACNELVSTYKGWLMGPLLGATIWAYPEWAWLDSDSPMSWRLDGWIGLEKWNAEADWCLREDFAHPRSFEHHVPMITAGIEQVIRFRWTEVWNIILDLQGTGAWGFRGHEEIYFADGVCYNSRVENTRWMKFSYRIGFGRFF